MRKTLVLLLVWAGQQMALHAQTGSLDLFVGTYTNAAKTNGIHVYRFDTSTGALTQRSVTTGISNPSYLAISSDNRLVYALSEVGRGQAKAHAYRYDGQSGILDQVNAVPAGGDGPCYISVDRDRKFVFTGMYSAGTLAAIPIRDDGSLGTNSQVIKFEGRGSHPQHQLKPHAHTAVLSHDNKFLLSTDLGTDRVHIYHYDDTKDQPLTETGKSPLTLKPGSGPRHLAFHPNGKYVYGVMELSAEVLAFRYKKGALISTQYTTMLEEGFKGEVEAADIHVSPDGKFLYASNRADGNDIVVYAIEKNGRLRYAGRQKEHIATPRGFVIDPQGKFVLVANMDGNNVVVFRRDAKTGLLSFTGHEAKIDAPVCLKFAHAQ